MQITDFRLTEQSGTIRAESTVIWEDTERSPLNLFVQTDADFIDQIWVDPNAFLVATILSAWDAGERRVLVHESLCPLLLNNLEGVYMMLKAWYPNDFGPVPIIEATKGMKTSIPTGKGVVSLMSAGIDSLCLLRANRLFYPLDHPDSIDAVLSVSHEEHIASNRQDLWDKFAGRMTAIRPIAVDTGVAIIPAIANMWWLKPDGYFYGQKSYSSFLSAITGMFGKGYNKGLIASSYDASFANKPWGSNPQLDAYYSSSHFRMENSGTEMTRQRKVEIIADWPIGLQSIRVCQNDNSGGSNCGTCEKCIRSMLMLESIGKLSECTAFPRNDIDVELLNYLELYDMLHSTDLHHDEEKLYMYCGIIPLLEKRGRTDLASELKRILNNLKERQLAG